MRPNLKISYVIVINNWLIIKLGSVSATARFFPTYQIVRRRLLGAANGYWPGSSHLSIDAGYGGSWQSWVTLQNLKLQDISAALFGRGFGANILNNIRKKIDTFWRYEWKTVHRSQKFYHKCLCPEKVRVQTDLCPTMVFLFWLNLLFPSFTG